MQSWTPTAGTPQGAVISPLLANLYLHPLDVKMSELGYRFEAGRRWVRHKSLKGFKDKVREKTKRTRGESMRTIIDDLTPMIRGWFGYFKHAHPPTHIHKPRRTHSQAVALDTAKAGKESRSTSQACIVCTGLQGRYAS